MVVVYVLEFVLALLYLATFFLSRQSFRITACPPNPERTILQRIRSAFETSFGEFHDAAMIFCFSILLATLATIAAGGSIYAMNMSFLACIFTMSMYFATFPLQLATRRRKRFRLVVGAIVAILVLAVYLALPQKVKKVEQSVEMDAWESLCFKNYSGKDYTRGTLGLFILGVVGFAIFFILPRALRSLGKDPSKIPIVKLLVAFPSNALSTGYFILVGLVSLALFLNLQWRVSNGGGGVTEESKWSFGQILALTTWAPAIIQLFYTLFGKSSQSKRSVRH